MKSTGKRFEEQFKKSIPKDIFYYRFRDSANTWSGGNKTRFTPSNIADCLIFDGDYLYLLELKSTKGKSLPYKNIKKHQIQDLLWASEFANTICGLVIEFSQLDEYYFIEIRQFKTFFDNVDRKSIPVDYCRKNGIKIENKKLKINNKLNINKFMIEAIERVV